MVYIYDFCSDYLGDLDMKDFCQDISKLNPFYIIMYSFLIFLLIKNWRDILIVLSETLILFSILIVFYAPSFLVIGLLDYLTSSNIPLVLLILPMIIQTTVFFNWFEREGEKLISATLTTYITRLG